MIETVCDPIATADESNNSLDGNGDGVNSDSFRREVSTATVGDANLDGRVTFADFLVVSANYGSSSVGNWRDGDFNGDRQVTFRDFLLLARQFDCVEANEPIQSR